MTAARDAEIAAIDLFLAEEKRLEGAPPQWGPSERRNELQAVWLVADSLNVTRARLQFRCGRSDRRFPSFSLIFRGNPIWRIDLVAQDTRERNPPWARELGLPPVLLGSHGHEWPDNREHLRTMPPDWTLPCRRPLPAAIRRLDQALPWFAERIRLELLPDQRGFDVPPQAELFGG